MKSLFIDSSGKKLSVAVIECGKLILSSNIDSYSKHSNFLMGEIINVINKLKMKISDIDNFIVVNGPGSFTGIRVGVTIAKTLAWSLNKKIYQISSLRAMSLVNDVKDVYISVLFDKKEESYVGIYTDGVFEAYANANELVLDYNNKNILVVSYDDNEFLDIIINNLSSNNNVEKQIIKELNYEKVVDYALFTNPINPHLVSPIYLKKIDVEKK
ncbi:MAG: tRNA (adenosine(37)-N6)-threonylcarbamoyltransferase complex dimerization subunit type 1 TsaB [Bacilli bacterium]